MLVTEIRSVEQLRELEPDSFYVSVNGRIVDWESLTDGVQFDVHIRLRGGKGGFGSLLRSFRIHRSTNQLMCRDLTGRRLADVKEEEKLRKWIENASNREEEKRRQRKEKYEKLKAGPPKHTFEDPKYIETREKLLDEADDAFEAGMATLSAMKKKKGEDKVVNVEDLPGPSGINRKRKASNQKKPLKHPKLSSKSLSVGERNEKEEKVDSAVESPFSIKASVEPSDANQDGKSAAAKEEEKSVAPKAEMDNMTDISLDDFESAESLETLGLQQLKYALEVRGLKCGGSLHERSVRLFSVKGLQPSEYPKAIRAPPKKNNLK